MFTDLSRVRGKPLFVPRISSLLVNPRKNFKIRHFKNEVTLSRTPRATAVGGGDGVHPAGRGMLSGVPASCRQLIPPMTSAAIMDRCDIHWGDFSGIFNWTGVRFISIGNKAL